MSSRSRLRQDKPNEGLNHWNWGRWMDCKQDEQTGGASSTGPAGEDPWRPGGRFQWEGGQGWHGWQSRDQPEKPPWQN